MSKKHVITLGEDKLMPDLSGALFMPNCSTLLVADLHLEQGTSLARRGIQVPPYDTHSTLQQLEQVLKTTGARQLILLGDSFHDAGAHGEIDEVVRKRLQAITSTIDTIWISGNHDPLPPVGLGGKTLDELSIGALSLRHIPGDIAGGGFEIAGHLHPGATIIQRNVHVHSKCFISDGRRLIMPAFGSYTGGLNVKSRAFQGLFNENTAKVWMLGKSGVHCFGYGRVS